MVTLVKLLVVFAAGVGLGVFASPLLAASYRMGTGILLPFGLVGAALLIGSVAWLLLVLGIGRIRRPSLDWRDE